MKRGFCGIGCFNMQKEVNYGTLFRSALNFEVDFIFLIGKRFKRQKSDTAASCRHIPLYEYDTFESFLANIPYDCQLVGIELTTTAKSLITFTHPTQAVYLLGPENGSLTEEIISKCQHVIMIPTNYCLNVAVAGAIVLYDRLVKCSVPVAQKDRATAF